MALRRSFKNVNNKLFKNNLLKTYWESYLNNVDFSFEKSLLELNDLIDIHALFKYSKRKNKKHKNPVLQTIFANYTRKKNDM